MSHRSAYNLFHVKRKRNPPFAFPFWEKKMAMEEPLLPKQSWRNAINSLLFYENLQLCDRTLWVPGSWDWPRMVMWMGNREHELFMISQVVILQQSFGHRTFCSNTVLLQGSRRFNRMYEIKKITLSPRSVYRETGRPASSPCAMLMWPTVIGISAAMERVTDCERSGHTGGSCLIFHTGMLHSCWLM